MFTKKIEDQFSADLLNTVQGVLDEAKKCKECGCAKCECENEEDEKDEMKEDKNLTGLPKSTAEKNKQYIEITHLLGHKRRVPVHPTNAYKALNRYRNDPSTKSARIVSEEIELEEGKMKDLVTKHMDAGHDYETALKKAKRDLDVPFDGPYRKPGTRKDQYGNVIKNVAKHLARKAMVKEEVEQIDEIGDTPAGKRALGRYIKDRRGTILGAGMGMEKQNKDRSTTDKQRKDLGRKTSNAFTGVARAVDRLTKEEIDPDLEDELKATRQTKKSVADAKKKYGMKEDSEHTNCGTPECCGECDTPDQIDEVSKKTLKNYLNKRSVQTTQSKLVGANLRHAMSHDVGLRGTKPLISPETTKELEKVSKQALDFSTKKGKSIELARKKIGVASDYRKKLKVPANEEVEHIDELSKKTLGNYTYKAASELGSKGITTGLKIAADEPTEKNFKKMANRQKGVATAVKKLTKEEQDFIDALNNDTLDEGRGRPPKEGSAAWKARQNQANDDMTALGVQLRKAKSMNKKVRFMDGKEHEIHPSHADRFEDHMAARKTSQDKAAFQKQAHKSHADFVKAVSAPVPKASKDTGEIVKYRH